MKKVDIEHLIALLAALVLLGALAYFFPAAALPAAIGAYTTLIASLRGSLFVGGPAAVDGVPVQAIVQALQAVAVQELPKLPPAVQPIVQELVK